MSLGAPREPPRMTPKIEMFRNRSKKLLQRLSQSLFSTISKNLDFECFPESPPSPIQKDSNTDKKNSYFSESTPPWMSLGAPREPPRTTPKIEMFRNRSKKLLRRLPQPHFSTISKNLNFGGLPGSPPTTFFLAVARAFRIRLQLCFHCFCLFPDLMLRPPDLVYRSTRFNVSAHPI